MVLTITKPKVIDNGDYDILKFWKGNDIRTLLTFPFFLTIDIFEMGLYRVHQDKVSDDPEVATALRQELVHATYHRRAFHTFRKNNIRFKYTRLWARTMCNLMYRTGTLEDYAGTFEYMISTRVYDTDIKNFDQVWPLINNPLASLMMWHYLEEAEHAYCFINDTILARPKIVRFLTLSSLIVLHTITAHVFMLENLRLFTWKKYIQTLRAVRGNQSSRSMWNLVFGNEEEEKKYMLRVSADATKVREAYGL